MRKRGQIQIGSQMVLRGEEPHEIEIEVEVSGTPVPGFRGSLYEPPEPPDVEDIRAWVKVAPGRWEEVPLTDDESATFREMLCEEMGL